MTSSAYLRVEILRTARNRMFLLFSLAFPLVLFLAVAGPNRHASLAGIPFPLYYMAGMAAWGTMIAVVSGAARIAAERSAGWTRQLRVTPLPARTYFWAKVTCSYLMAIASMAVLFLAGTALGVRLPVTGWLTTAGLLLAGLVPFAVLSILLGHVLAIDSLGPAMGGITSLLALIGGVFGPVATGGIWLSVARAIPSYWLVQAGKTAFGGHDWPREAWLVIAVWTVALAGTALRAYRRDTDRV
jgi:ABC-2 type transport system permease protein